MVVRYEERFREMMAQAEVSPEVMRGLLDRLEAFVHPFCASLGAGERRLACPIATTHATLALKPGSPGPRPCGLG